ncbi:SIMPL domain-containing protein [Agaribacterium sp. ZY112]|uniref:SIMPL domain-containing protein n=1 Tax=Agaribacterium sp. ZY112 TaxID=3233574 RepID=UPI003524007D
MRLAGLFLVLLCSSQVFAFDSDDRFIQVSGEASKSVSPDQMHWNISISNEGVDLQSVAKQHSQISKQTLSSLKDILANDSKLQSQNMNLRQRTQWKNGKNINTGFIASSRISFTLNDVELYQQLWSSLAGIKGVQINNVSYDVSNREALEQEVQLTALTNAKAKAERMAAALGQKIGKPLSISEAGQAGPMPLMKTRAMSAAVESEELVSGQKSIELGEIKIRGHVAVSFELK